METITVARRYAKALFSLAAEHKMVRRVAQDLRHMEHHFQALPEMRSFLCNAELPIETRRAYLYRFFPTRASRLVKNFYNILLDQERCSLIDEIIREYRALWEESMGVVRAEVETRFPLTRTGRRRLQAALNRFTGEKVELRERIEPALIAGVRIRIGDRLFDYSLASQLQQLQKRLSGG